MRKIMSNKVLNTHIGNIKCSTFLGEIANCPLSKNDSMGHILLRIWILRKLLPETGSEMLLFGFFQNILSNRNMSNRMIKASFGKNLSQREGCENRDTNKLADLLVPYINKININSERKHSSDTVTTARWLLPSVVSGFLYIFIFWSHALLQIFRSSQVKDYGTLQRLHQFLFRFSV